MTEEAKGLISRLARLRSARSTWETHWQDLANVMLPRRAEFTTISTPGAKRTQDIYDGTAMQAVRDLASAVDAMLKPKASTWFSIVAENETLNDDETIKAWLEAARRRMRRAIYNKDARFIQHSGEVDTDLVTFGTGILFIGEVIGKGRLRFRSIHLKDSYLAEDPDGKIDTLFRVFKLSARQARAMFGQEKLSDPVKEALEKDEPDTEFRFLHATLPREDRDPGRRDNRNMPFASLIIDIDAETFMEESGFHEFPYAVPRWDTSSGEMYGRSPGMIALNDSQTVNAMGKTLLEAGELSLRPPLMAPDDGLTSVPRLFSGGITYYDSTLFRQGGRIPIQPIQTGANLPLTLEMQNKMRDQIWSAFFRNVLRLPLPGPQMTATEILERRQEFLRVIGPTFQRLEAEYVGQITERVFGVLMRAGVFPPIPDALRGRRVDFSYASPVQKAQQLIEVAAAAATIDQITPFVARDPTIMDNFNGDQIARDIAESREMPRRWLRGLPAVQAIREQRAQIAEQEMAKADAERAAEGISKLADVAATAAPRAP